MVEQCAIWNAPRACRNCVMHNAAISKRGEAMRTAKEMLHDWVDEVSNRLQRPADQIRERGLRATDFRSGSRVRITFCDGSSVDFRYAFACIRPASARVAVFTEHCGYHEFALSEDDQVVETTEVFYRHTEAA
jgi:hypothetical protein